MILKLINIRAAGAATKRKLDKMTPTERRQTLIDSGILTKTGRVAKPYRGVFQ